MLPRQQKQFGVIRRLATNGHPWPSTKLSASQCTMPTQGYMVGTIAVSTVHEHIPDVLLRCVTRTVYHHKPPPSMGNPPLQAQCNAQNLARDYTPMTNVRCCKRSHETSRAHQHIISIAKNRTRMACTLPCVTPKNYTATSAQDHTSE